MVQGEVYVWGNDARPVKYSRSLSMWMKIDHRTAVGFPQWTFCSYLTGSVSFSGYVFRSGTKTLPWDDSRYGPRNRNRYTVLMGKLREGRRRLREGYKRLNQNVIFGVMISISYNGHVLASKERRYRGTNADTGLVTVTGRRSS